MNNSISSIIAEMAPTWDKKPGATPEQIRQAEAVFHVRFPEDYRQLLLWSNGGEGPLGPPTQDAFGEMLPETLYLAIWSVQDLKQVNEGYEVNKYLPGVVFVGTDTGAIFYALDFRKDADNPLFIAVSGGAFFDEDITILGRSMREVLGQALAGEPAKFSKQEVRF